MTSRSYKERDLKRLFALSRNVCAFPACDQRLADPAWPSVQAEICHIAGLQEGSARFDPLMSDEERNGYENLLLLRLSHESRLSHPRFGWRGMMGHGCERAWLGSGSDVFDAAVGEGLAA